MKILNLMKYIYIYIYYIEIKEELRRKGIFSSFIKELYKLDSIKKLGILAVGSYEMLYTIYSLREKGIDVISYGGDYIVEK